MKKPAAPPPPPPPPAAEPPPPKADDRVDNKAPTRLGSTFGARQPQEPVTQAMPLSVGPAELSPDHGVRDAERLQILVRSPNFQRTEKMWLERAGQKLAMATPMAARKIGFGLWRKRYNAVGELAQALESNLLPVFERLLGGELGRLGETDAPEVFVLGFPELAGDPPLHQDYVADQFAFAFSIHQDDIKHVAHSYVMALGHAFVRRTVSDKRALGVEAVQQRSGLTAEQIYVFEANLCQYYVPQATHAYFEGQPMRIFARELANRFRKVAFGGQ